MEKAKVKILPKPAASPLPHPLSQGLVLGGGRTPKRGASFNAGALGGMDEAHTLKRSRKQLAPAASTAGSAASMEDKKANGHRPVTLCTFCRQHKIKCNAMETMPSPCQRCDKMGLKCEIDPEFRPKKGLQIQLLKTDVDELKLKIEMLTKNETLLTQALQQHNVAMQGLGGVPGSAGSSTMSPSYYVPTQSPTFNDALASSQGPMAGVLHDGGSDNSPATTVSGATPQKAATLPDYPELLQFVLGDVTLTAEKAAALHNLFMTKNLPYLPILTLSLASELYHRLQLLFWVVMLTASLLEPEPTLYMLLATLIKQLAIETCWIRTPRSTHVIQLLIILAMWPLPNEKVLDDCLYRFIGLAKNLGLQLGLHRGGRFIQEFTRTQVSLGPDANTWRTRSWLAIFFCDQFWLLVLGLPPLINLTDYLLENARVDKSLPKDFRCLILLLIFQLKLVNIMGVLVTRADGLLEPLNRAALLLILERELDRLKFKLEIADGLAIEIYHLYIKLMICCFAFLPGTPIEDQVRYVLMAYLLATRIVTISSQMVGTGILLIELPIYVRQALEYSVLMLFKLHLSRYLIEKYVDSLRQSIVTVHRLLRNTLSSWQDLKNDISRIAKVLENLNIVLYTYPDIFLAENEQQESIITRMRSHLTALLFYDLVWCVHEARRRTNLEKEGKAAPTPATTDRRLAPLPFYNQITKDDFKTLMTTTPNGTTITTLIPTDRAMDQARSNANADNKPLEINGIPLAMLEATGSMKEMPTYAPTPGAAPAEVAPVAEVKQEFSGQQQWEGSNAGTPFIALLVDGNLVIPDVMPLDNQAPVVNQMDSFFQQQSNGWLNNGSQDDDFLGWFDLNLIPDKQ